MSIHMVSQILKTYIFDNRFRSIDFVFRGALLFLSVCIVCLFVCFCFVFCFCLLLLLFVLFCFSHKRMKPPVKHLVLKVMSRQKCVHKGGGGGERKKKRERERDRDRQIDR